MPVCVYPECEAKATRLRPVKGEPEPRPYCEYHDRILFDPSYLGFTGAGAPVNVKRQELDKPMLPAGLYLPTSNPEWAQAPHPASPAVASLQPSLDLGAGHVVEWAEWEGLVLGLVIRHPRVNGTQIVDWNTEGGARAGGAAALSRQPGDPCQLSVVLDTEAFWRKTAGKAAATLVAVASWEPLTLGDGQRPAVLHCECGDFGTIAGGVWIDGSEDEPGAATN